MSTSMSRFVEARGSRTRDETSKPSRPSSTRGWNVRRRRSSGPGSRRRSTPNGSSALALAGVRDGFAVAPTVLAALRDDLAACRDQVRPRIAPHVGGRGSRNRNFLETMVDRYGHEAQAAEIWGSL